MIFENLSQLESNQRLHNDMLMSIKISLQRRNRESLAILKSKFDLHLDEFITPDVLFQMLVVGTAIEKMSEYYRYTTYFKKSSVELQIPGSYMCTIYCNCRM
jgi:hypothetical protein